MTIVSVIGSIEMPPVEAGQQGKRMAELPPEAPPGYPVVSEFFYPNPKDEVDSVATFNVFLASTDFDGTVSLLKQPMGGKAAEKNVWFKPAAGTPLKALYDWLIKPGSAFCIQVHEPENNVRYCLAFISEIEGANIMYRMSL